MTMGRSKRLDALFVVLIIAALTTGSCGKPPVDITAAQSTAEIRTNHQALIPAAPVQPTPTAQIAQPPVETPESTAAEDKPPIYDVPLSDELQAFMYEACETSGVPFELALALMGNESGYRADVISRTNDYGLMQINVCNHEWLTEQIGVEDFLDPEENIRAGLHILSLFCEKYDDAHHVLMAYNMGESGAQKLWNLSILVSEVVNADRFSTFLTFCRGLVTAGQSVTHQHQAGRVYVDKTKGPPLNGNDPNAITPTL